MKKIINYQEVNKKCSKEAVARAQVAAAIGGGLKAIYDPVAEAALPASFGQPLGWLYFIMSEAGAVERTAGAAPHR